MRDYQVAFEAAMSIFELSKDLPAEERYSLTDQICRSSRSVCANLAESWRKRRYPAHFASKLTDAQSEAEETRVWLQLSSRCGYLARERALELDSEYDHITGRLVHMSTNLDTGSFDKSDRAGDDLSRLPFPLSPPPSVAVRLKRPCEFLQEE